MPLIFKKGKKRGSGELQAASLTSVLGKADGENLPGKCFQTHEGQEGEWDWSPWVYKGVGMLNQPDSFLQ